MTGLMKFAPCSVLAVLLFGGGAQAQVALLSNVPPVITLSPGPTFAGNPIGTYHVTIEDMNGPVQGASVEITFSSGADALIAWCVGQIHPVVGPKTTDANGNVDFTFYGGGCVNPDEYPDQSCAAPVATVLVSGPTGGFTKSISRVISPDWVGGASGGSTPSCPSGSNCYNNITRVSIADAIHDIRPIKLGLIEPCAKFVSPFDTAVGIDDSVYLTPYVKLARSCTCQ